MGDFSPGIAGGASVALLLVLFSALFRFVALMTKRDRDCAWEVSELKADLQWAEQQKSELIVACQQHEIAVPAIAWTTRPRPPTRRERKKTER